MNQTIIEFVGIECRMKTSNTGTRKQNPNVRINQLYFREMLKR